MARDLGPLIWVDDDDDDPVATFSMAAAYDHGQRDGFWNGLTTGMLYGVAVAAFLALLAVKLRVVVF